MEIAIKHINDAIKNNSLIIFVGAGVSANSGLPNWDELVNEFKKEMNINENKENYLRIAQYYYNEVGKQKYLQKISEVFQQYKNAQPNKIHNEIFRIKPRHIITTNYDSLLEKKMESSIYKYEIIKDDKDIPYSKAESYLIKMHGDLEQRNIILKEDDYIDYENNFYMVATLIKSLIMNNTVLFLGYSLNDSTFNSIFRLIQKGFDGNAKKAYFFSTSKQNEFEVRYYKEKGIEVVIGKDDDKGKCTVDFLSSLDSDSTAEPNTSEKLWDNIKFLDSLFFVENSTVEMFTNLRASTILLDPTKLEWRSENHISLNISKNKSITDFLDNNTWFSSFLDFESKKEYQFTQNPILSEGYILYQEQRFGEAKKKFREIANKSFIQKDYWNYLIAEYNVKYIQIFFEKSLRTPASVTGNDNLYRIVEYFSINGDENTKKISSYFRDEILSFKFIYRKNFEINKLLDKLKEERNSYKNGGISYNSDLETVRFKFKSLLTFINANCLAVFQYQEFGLIVNRYFECLLVAHSNYQVQNNNNITESTTSIIKELKWDEIEYIIPYIDNIQTLMNSYELSKIKLSKEALNQLLIKINKLFEDFKIFFSVKKMQYIEKHINFLSFVKFDDADIIIPILDKYPIMKIGPESLKNLLKTLIKEKDSINTSEYENINSIINNHLKKIITSEKIDMYNSIFPLYAQLLYLINNSNNFSINIYELEEKIYLINKKDGMLKKIIKYRDLLINIYKYLEDDLKSIVDEILAKYEKLSNSEINLYFIKDLVLANVHNFNSKKDKILESEILDITKEYGNGVEIYPDPKKMAIIRLLYFLEQGYFTLDEVREKLDLNSIEGVLPEADWILIKKKSDEVINKLVKKYKFSHVRKHFCKTKEECKKLDEWLLKNTEEDKMELYNKSY